MKWNNRKACEEMMEQRYRSPEDFPHNPIPKLIKKDGRIFRNPEWDDAPYGDKFFWLEDC